MNGITLDTAITSLQERLDSLNEALSYCRRKKAVAILKAERDEVAAEIRRRRNLQTALTGVQS